jgi:hypothetical protein
MLAEAEQIVNKLLLGEPDFDPQRYVDELPPVHIERWALTDAQTKDPSGFNSLDKLVAEVTYEENNEQLQSDVIVYRNGRVTNRYRDGGYGVPKWLRDLANNLENLYDPEAGEYTEHWRDVFTRDDGSFVTWAE